MCVGCVCMSVLELLRAQQMTAGYYFLPLSLFSFFFFTNAHTVCRFVFLIVGTLDCDSRKQEEDGGNRDGRFIVTFLPVFFFILTKLPYLPTYLALSDSTALVHFTCQSKPENWRSFDLP